jgi:hypothetical protein
MSKMQMRLDYNNLMRQICDLLYNSEDEMVQANAFGIGIGLELLTSYMKGIATLAIERNDKELLEICKNLLIVTEESEDTE